MRKLDSDPEITPDPSCVFSVFRGKINPQRTQSIFSKYHKAFLMFFVISLVKLCGRFVFNYYNSFKPLARW